jgi:hypothetical protein
MSVRIECSTADITPANIAGVLQDALVADFARRPNFIPFYSTTLRAPAWIIFEDAQ